MSITLASPNSTSGVFLHTAEENKLEVEDYLNDAPELNDITLDGIRVLSEAFTHNTEFNIVVFIDPESQEPHKELFIEIKTSLDFDEATNLMEKVDDEWYMALPNDVHDKFNIDLVFV